MSKKSRYYLKLNVAIGGLVLDFSKETTNAEEVLVVDALITEEQGKLLRDAIKKYDNQYFSEVQFEFEQLFSVCVDCNKVSTRSEMRKAQGERCVPCWKRNVEEKKVIYFRDRDRQRDFERQLRKLKLHLKTKQGLVDSIPMDIIESNVRIELAKSGKTFKQLSDSIGVSTTVIYNLFKNKYVRYERLLQISEFLRVPLSTLLEVPIGVKIPKTQGVPNHMIEGRVPYLDEAVPRDI